MCSRPNQRVIMNVRKAAGFPGCFFVWGPVSTVLSGNDIKDPKAMMIGTTQVYRGLMNDADIEALILYLREASK